MKVITDNWRVLNSLKLFQKPGKYSRNIKKINNNKQYSKVPRKNFSPLKIVRDNMFARPSDDILRLFCC